MLTLHTGDFRCSTSNWRSSETCFKDPRIIKQTSGLKRIILLCYVSCCCYCWAAYFDTSPALTQTADGSIKANIVEVGLGGLPVPRVLLRPVAHVKHLLLAVRCVGVKVDLGIHAHHCWQADTWDFGIRGKSTSAHLSICDSAEGARKKKHFRSTPGTQSLSSTGAGNVNVQQVFF